MNKSNRPPCEPSKHPRTPLAPTPRLSHLRQRLHRDGLVVRKGVLLRLHPPMVDQRLGIRCEAAHGHADVRIDLRHLLDAGGLLKRMDTRIGGISSAPRRQSAATLAPQSVPSSPAHPLPARGRTTPPHGSRAPGAETLSSFPQPGQCPPLCTRQWPWTPA